MLILSGFLVGLIVGLTGVGGGALMTPLLLLIFRVAPLTAIGTDLWFAAITKTVAGSVFRTKGLIDWNVLRYLWAGSLPASLVVMLLIHYNLISIDFNFLKKQIAIAITACTMIAQKKLHEFGRHLRLTQTSNFKHWQPPLTILAGVFLGGIVTLTSIGAGALGAVLLSYLYPLRLTPPRLVATDIVHAIPLALFTGTGHLFMGDVDTSLLFWLICGSIPGVMIGAILSGKISHGLLRLAIACVLIAVSLKMLLS